MVHLALLLAGRLLAQWPTLPFDSILDDMGTARHTVRAGISLDVNANTLDNALLADLWRGAFLDRDLRERVRDGLKERNSAGYHFQQHVQWIGADSLFGKAGWHPTVGIARHDILGLRFAPDLYTATFFGNAVFEGDTARLGPSAHQAVQYFTGGLGISDRHGRSFLRVDVVAGVRYNASDLRIADLYTATDGRALGLDLAGDLWQSDTTRTERPEAKGWGGAISGAWTSDHLVGNTPVALRFAVEDLGIIRWNERSLRLARDTIIDYQGLEIASITALDETLLDGDQLLDTFGLRYNTGSLTTLLPFRATMNADIRLSDHWHAGVAVRQMNLPGFVPEITLSGARRFGDRAQVGAGLSYGGFGGPRLGVGGRLRVQQNTWLTLSTPHLPGFLLGRTRGIGALFGMAMSF